MKIHRIKPISSQTKSLHNSSGGLTIIELLIATTILSVVLLLAAFSLLQIGRTYYKGITLTRTQNAARSIIDTISQDIQFSGTGIDVPPDPYPNASGSTYAICIGDHRYSVLLDRQLVDGTPDTSLDQANHVFILDTDTSCSHDKPVDFAQPLSSDAKELLYNNMRVAKLEVRGLAYGFYLVDLTIVYGNKDLLESGNQKCKTQAGSQFCSAVNLSTVVQKRIQ